MRRFGFGRRKKNDCERFIERWLTALAFPLILFYDDASVNRQQKWTIDANAVNEREQFSSLKKSCSRESCPSPAWTLPRCRPCWRTPSVWPSPRCPSTRPSWRGACHTPPWWRSSSPARTSSWTTRTRSWCDRAANGLTSVSSWWLSLSFY